MSEQESLDNIISQAKEKISSASSLDTLNQVRIEFLGKKGLVSLQAQKLGKLPPEERKEFGQLVNKVKQAVEAELINHSKKLEEEALNKRLTQETLDVTLPAREVTKGKIHPITQATEEIIAIFGTLGFEVKEGPNIEDDWHNFTALNIDENHPARQMHDTFYMSGNDNLVLRTHTSPVQIRTMKEGKPPFRFIAPGRTYRCDSDITHAPMFHQVEGVVVDKHVNMAHLKFVIIEFLKTFFEKDEVPVQFRPSFFPFTEPSAEVDIGCSRKDGELNIGAGDDWLEVLGCGMIHPDVLRNAGIDPKEYQGFAFGMGIERLAMLKYGIPDLRDFFEGDMRWLEHYGFNYTNIPNLVGGLTK